MGPSVDWKGHRRESMNLKSIETSKIEMQRTKIQNKIYKIYETFSEVAWV